MILVCSLWLEGVISQACEVIAIAFENETLNTPPSASMDSPALKDTLLVELTAFTRSESP